MIYVDIFTDGITLLWPDSIQSLTHNVSFESIKFEIKFVDSTECPLRNNMPEIIEHALIKCQSIHTLWQLIELWLRTILNDIINISDPEKDIWNYL